MHVDADVVSWGMCRAPLLSVGLFAFALAQWPAPGTSETNDSAATVLYFTDAHELAPVRDTLGERGGLARLKTVLDRARRANPESAVVAFGGDLAGGVLFGAVFHGFPVVEALNLLPVDVATFGQHDFDFGAEEAERLVAASKFPWITSNLTTPAGQPFAGLPRVLICERGGMRIGFLGLTDAMDTTRREGKVVQGDLVSSATSAIAELQRQKVDAIVALTQADLPANEHLLESLPAIDAILSEERNETRSMAHFVGGRPIVSPGGNIATLAELQLRKSPGGRVSVALRVHPVDATVPPHAGLATLEQKYTKVLNDRLSAHVATLARPLASGAYGDNRARYRESNAGNLIADAYRAHHKADIGVMHGGGIRASVPAGPLTVKDVLAMLPFGNRVVLLKLRGSVLRAALEHGVSQVEKRSGRFLQVSGMSYSYDPARLPGDRIESVGVGSAALDPNRQYTVALSNHIARGGDGFSMLAATPALVPASKAPVDADVVREHCKRLGTVDIWLEGRITRLGHP